MNPYSIITIKHKKQRDETFNGSVSACAFTIVFVSLTGISSSSELSSEEEDFRFLFLVPDKLFPTVFEVTLDMDFLDTKTSSELSSEDEPLFYKLK